MNYWERYGGDYSRDTAHLSLAEHGAYSLLLDAYYAMEKPFGADYGPLYRLCRAMSKPEQAAVRAVADEFFPITEDGLRHQQRADREIAKAMRRINTSRDNGAKGGRKRATEQPAGLFDDNPTGNPSGNPPGIPTGNPTGNPSATCPGKALPDPTRHTLLPKGKNGEKVRAPAKHPLPSDFQVSERVAVWAAEKGYDRLGEYLEAFIGKAKAGGYTYTDWDAAFMNSIREDWGRVRERPPTQTPANRRVAL